MISFDPVENQLTIQDNNNKTETFSFTNLQWENLLQYYRKPPAAKYSRITKSHG